VHFFGDAAVARAVAGRGDALVRAGIPYARSLYGLFMVMTTTCDEIVEEATTG
jgi:hypothetical protein